MKILVLTNMYPTLESPNFGIFVKKQVDSLEKEGIEIKLLFINGRKTIFNYLTGIFRLLTEVSKNKYTLVHAHYGFSGIIARLQWTVPVIVTFHGSDVNLPFQCFLSRLLARHINKSIVVSSRLKERLKARRSEVLACGVDLDLMVPLPIDYAKKEIGLSLNTHYLLFPGDPADKGKGISLFSEVVKKLKHSGLDVEELILKDIPHNKVPLYYNSASVMVFTSEREGSPLVIKEALACNLPIVSVKVGDTYEKLKRIKGCFLVQRDASIIAEKVKIALSMGRLKNGHEYVKENSLKIVAKEIICVYNSILKQ